MRHAFDPELAPIVEMLPTLAYDDPAAFRQQATEFAAAMMQRPETAVPVEVRDVAVPGPAGAPDVPVRIYAPNSGHDKGENGALVYFHGGGWMGGDVAGNDGMTYALAAESGAVVVSVEYRLAAVAQDAATGKLVTTVTAYPLDEAATAQQVSDAGHVRGKLVLTLD